VTIADDVRAPSRPYPGIESYSFGDRFIFFGRDAEARKLMHLLILYRGVMLFGDSGVGKSSLLNAAILPAAVEEDFTPVFIRVRPRASEELAIQPVEDDTGTLRPVLTVPDVGENTLSCSELLEVLRDPQLVGADRHPLLVFDQFEELVTLFGEPAGIADDGTDPLAIQRRIIDLIHTLLTDDALRVKVVLSFREDYLAKLRDWFGDVPYFDEHYLRVESLRADAEVLHRLIRRPFEVYPGRFANEISESLASAVAEDLVTRSGGHRVGLSELQVVCRGLWESGAPEATFRRHGSDRIIEDFYTSALHLLSSEHQRVSIDVLARLVTSSGTRNIVSRDDLVAQVTRAVGVSEALVGETLDELHGTARLVSREQRRGVEFYEVVSEHTIPWIVAQTRDRVDAQEVTELRQELFEGVRNETLRYVRFAGAWRRWWIFISLLLLGGVVGLLIWDATSDEPAWVAGVGGSLVLALVAFTVVGAIGTRRSGRRASRAELICEQARRFLDDATPTTREEVNDIRSEFRQRYVPLPLDHQADHRARPIATQSESALGPLPPTRAPVVEAGSSPPPRVDVTTRTTSVEGELAKRDLLAGSRAEADWYLRRAAWWRRGSLAAGLTSFAAAVIFAGLAGEDTDQQPWSSLYVVFFYVTFAVPIAWFGFGRRARKRAGRAEQLYEEAAVFLGGRHPRSGAEVRSLRSEFRARYVPLPIDADREAGSAGWAPPSADAAARHGSVTTRSTGATDATEIGDSGGDLAPPDRHVSPSRPQPRRAAAWLPDPTGRHEQRYWDGAKWSEHVADGGVPSEDPTS
jgi:hypothetical protein